MTSIHVPAIEAGKPSPCHSAALLSGGPARVWCRRCGADFQARPAEIVIIPDQPDSVVEEAARRAHELEMERLKPSAKEGAYAPVTPGEAAAHRRALEVAIR